MEMFVSTINDSQPLTVVAKNFDLDATGVLEFKSDFMDSLWTVSAVQSSSTITLEQCIVESCFDFIVLTLRRWNAESV